MMLTAATYCPRGTIEVDGQTLPISQNTALFSLVGTTYGGNGTSNFDLPDLRGRTPIQLGQGPGLPDYDQGEANGAVSTTLTTQNLPAHTHSATATLSASGQTATTASPAGNSLAASSGGSIYRARGAPDQALNSGSVAVTVASAGGGLAFDNRTPYLTLRWCIALEGIYPPRND
nr:tail fiber protein [Jiella avicenniae]